MTAEKGDIDFEAGTLSVRHALQRMPGGLQRTEPKSDRSRRTIAMPTIVAKALRGHRARQLTKRLAAGSRWQETGFVFTTTLGTPMDERAVHKRFKAVLAGAGLRNQRFHDLRHACAFKPPLVNPEAGLDGERMTSSLGRSEGRFRAQRQSCRWFTR